jgi:cytoskeleton protein RodZ
MMARKAQTKKTDESTTAQVQTSVENINVPNQTAQTATEPVIETGSIPTSGCGGVLRAAREKLGLSIDDISTQLRISPKQINAIEADQFSLLPQPSIVRGFIRNYAKALKIDVEPILASYQTLNPSSTPQSFAVKSSANASVIGQETNQFSFKHFIALIITFSLIAGAVYYYTQQIQPTLAPTEPRQDSTTAPADQEATQQNMPPEFALPAAERQTEESSTETSVAIELPTATNNPVNTENPNLASEQSATITNNAPSTQPSSTPTTKPMNTDQNSVEKTVATTKPETVRNTSQLTFTATEQSWVNIVDAQGKEVFNKVLNAGDTQHVEITPPFKLTVGNAQATTLSVNQKAFDLTPYTRVKVARVQID